MSWSVEDYTIITPSGGSAHYFAPTELRYSGSPLVRKNQRRMETESGIEIVSTIDQDLRNIYEFTVTNMPLSDRSVSGTTVRGLTSLNTLIQTDLNWAEVTATLKLTRDGVGTTHTVRLWVDQTGFALERGGRSAAIPARFGNGYKLLFREVIT